MTSRWDFSAEGRARVALITVLGAGISMIVAVTAVSFTTPMMDELPRRLTWAAAIGIPLFVSVPIFYLFASKLRDLAIAHAQLVIVASQDSLTGCLNRGAFVTLVDAYLSQVNAAIEPAEGALLVVDADHFKDINDQFGHAMGDQALRLVSSGMKSSLRTIDLIGRIGGEEFAIFLPRARRPQAEAIAERIRVNVERLEFRPDQALYKVTVSIGVALFRGSVSFDDLFRAADARLYDAKSRGRNRVEFAAPLELAPVHPAYGEAS